MEIISVKLDFKPKLGPKGNPLNKQWEIAGEISKKVQLSIPLILRLLKKNEHSVLRALDDLEEISQTKDIQTKGRYFLYLYKKHNTSL